MRFTICDWKIEKLSNIAHFKQGDQYPINEQKEIFEKGYIRFIRIIDYTQKDTQPRYVKYSSNNNIVSNDDIVMVRYGASAGLVGRGIEGNIANNMFSITPVNHINKRYLYNYLSSNKIYTKLNSSNGSSAMPALNFGIVGQLSISFPCNVNEQIRISNFIDILNDRIFTQKKIICLLESQINQIRNTLINSIEKQHSFILFGDIIKEYNEKTTANNMYPVLSSTKSGIHLQSEYFNKEAASDDTTGYKIIPKGYCTYRSMSDTGEFTFNIQNIIETGIVSPAYPVFTSKYNNEFIIEYLNNSTKLRNNILSLKEGGTRFALSLKKLMTLEIPKISIEEQKEFMDLVITFNKKIKNEKQILSLYEKQKKYLLDKLFI